MNGNEYKAEISGTNISEESNVAILTVTSSGITVSAMASESEICAGESVTLTATGATNYTWDNSAGTGASVTVSPTVTTTYTVTGDDGSGNIDTDEVTVIVNSLPAVDAGMDVAICSGEDVSISASGAATYFWDNSLGAGVTHTVAPTITTTYTVVGTDVNGCEKLDDVVVTVNELPTITASATDELLCSGSSTTITASGATTYDWDNSLGAGQNHTVAPTVTTTYIATGTSSDGCVSTGQVEIVVSVCTDLQPSAFEVVDVYPNPFQNELTIKAGGQYQLKVYDLFGAIIYDEAKTGKAVLSQDWVPGIYLVEIVGENYTEVVKLIKE